MYNGKEFVYAKRREIIPKVENFFDHLSITSFIEPKIAKLFTLFEDVTNLYVYGELFGGKYPHDDVKPIEGIQAIQTGVYYSPKIEFYAFDIQIENSKGKFYVDYEESIIKFKKCEMLCAEPLFIGKYEQCLSFEFKFETTIPKKLGYPTIKGNIAEGIVIKPLTTIYVESKKGKFRPILKVKPKEFMEDSRFHQAEKWETEIKKEKVSNYEMLIFEALPLITEQRIETAKSKIGKITKENADQLLNEYIDDILLKIKEDFEKEYEGLSTLEKEEFRKLIKKESVSLMKQYFNKNLK